jgi:hypothetical protein
VFGFTENVKPSPGVVSSATKTLSIANRTLVTPALSDALAVKVLTFGPTTPGAEEKPVLGLVVSAHDSSARVSPYMSISQLAPEPPSQDARTPSLQAPLVLAAHRVHCGEKPAGPLLATSVTLSTPE